MISRTGRGVTSCASLIVSSWFVGLIGCGWSEDGSQNEIRASQHALHDGEEHGDAADAGGGEPNPPPQTDGGADAPSSGGEPQDPGLDACEDTITDRTGAACADCSAASCGAELAACDGECLGLISCVVDACGGDGDDLACITASCSSCLGAATPATDLGGCLTEHCADVCEYVEPAPPGDDEPPLPPEDEPPPPDGEPEPPSADACEDDLANAVGDACVECGALECPDETADCDGSCRSLLTCVVNACDSDGEDIACIAAECSSCLDGAGPAEATADCLQARCADECALGGAPPTDGGGGTGGAGGSGGDGDGDGDDPEPPPPPGDDADGGVGDPGDRDDDANKRTKRKRRKAQRKLGR